MNFPEILLLKDLGCAATASSKAARDGGGGVGRGGVSSLSTDFAVMDLKSSASSGIGIGLALNNPKNN